MSDKPELKPCQNNMCALHGNKGNKCLYWGDNADVESCCCYSADLAKPSEWISVEKLKSPEFLREHGLVMMPEHMFSTCGVFSCGYNEGGTCELDKTRTCVPFRRPLPSPPAKTP